MSDQPDARSSKRKLIVLALLAIFGLGGLLVAMRLGLDPRALITQALAGITDAGPLIFFGAVAMLPLFGVPLLPLVLTAGPAFGPSLGMPLVITYTLAAITLNMMMAYTLAQRAFRPFLTRIIEGLGHKVPSLEGGDATDLVILLRVTPGVPFCVQNYLSGLANVPFIPYAVVSCIVAWCYNTAFVLFGDALLHGKGRMILIAVGAIVALVAATHMIRRHYAARKAAQ